MRYFTRFFSIDFSLISTDLKKGKATVEIRLLF